MAKINLFQINKPDELKERLAVYQCSHLQHNIFDMSGNAHVVSIYLQEDSPNPKELSWKWVLDSFGLTIEDKRTSPKAIVLFESDLGCYAATFGASYFLVNEYCNRDYPFNIARRIELKKVKTTTLNSQSTTRNRMIYSYSNCAELIFESGEAFAKIKASVNLGDKFKHIKQNMQFGTSISFITKEGSLKTIADFIWYGTEVLLNNKEINKIPIYQQITDKDRIEREIQDLKNKLDISLTNAFASEVEIVGTMEIIQNEDYSYVLKYNDYEEAYPELNSEAIEQFIIQYPISPLSNILNIKVVVFKDEKPVVTKRFYDFIDWINDENASILSQGKWYHFNDDFIEYLHESILAIQTTYEAKYDFSKKEFQYKNSINKGDLSYRERYFNTLRKKDGFILKDGVMAMYDHHKFESHDLEKDGVIYSVKIGKGASKLAYVIQQSLTSLQLHKNGKNPYSKGTTHIGIWLVLDRANMLKTDERGTPNINEIYSITLKISLDNWRKQVLQAGFIPSLKINYVIE